MLEGGFCYIKRFRNRINFFKSLNPYYAGRWLLLNNTAYIIDLSTSCLNPYYVGRWFLLFFGVFANAETESLNPYYVGRWFLL